MILLSTEGRALYKELANVIMHHMPTTIIQVVTQAGHQEKVNQAFISFGFRVLLHSPQIQESLSRMINEGLVVDEEALVEHLTSNPMFNVGLDVFEGRKKMFFRFYSLLIQQPHFEQRYASTNSSFVLQFNLQICIWSFQHFEDPLWSFLALAFGDPWFSGTESELAGLLTRLLCLVLLFCHFEALASLMIVTLEDSDLKMWL